jgi:methionyl-tRNA formyltransferase
MKKISQTIIFFGSGPVAAKSLELICKNFVVEAVITKPQPENHLYKFPVIEVAENNNLDLYYASNKKQLEEIVKKYGFKSKIGIVVDYGIIISQEVIDYFPFGIINSHFSLLPKWRGADPISFSILSGDKSTGVSLMVINDKLDEGKLISQKSFSLDSSTNSIELTERLINLSDLMLKEKVPKYLDGTIKPYDQTGEPTYSRKLSKQDSKLDFNKSAAMLDREIRAFIEWPRSYCFIKDLRLIITKAHVVNAKDTPGKLYMDSTKKELGFYTKEGLLLIDRLIPNGKKEMPVEAFLAGYKVT